MKTMTIDELRQIKQKPDLTDKEKEQGNEPKKLGRPPIDNPRRRIARRLDPDVADSLDSLEQSGRVLDDLIKRTKGFKEWKAKQ